MTTTAYQTEDGKHRISFTADIVKKNKKSVTLSIPNEQGDAKEFKIKTELLATEGFDVNYMEAGYSIIPFSMSYGDAHELGIAQHLGLQMPAPESSGNESAPETVTLKGFFNGYGMEDDFYVFIGEGEPAPEYSFPLGVVTWGDQELAYGDEADFTMPLALALEKGLVGQQNVPAEIPHRTPPVMLRHPELKWLGNEQITVTQELSETEKASYAESMATLDAEIEELEERRDRVSKSLKKQIDAKEEERRGLSKVVRTGSEERAIFCDKVADYDSGEIKWADAETGDVVDKRPMAEDERQFPLPLEAKPEQEEGIEYEALADGEPEATENGKDTSPADGEEAETIEGMPETLQPEMAPEAALQ